MSDKKAITPSAYRKAVYNEEYVTVPSGATFKIKRMSPIDALKKGLDELPNPYIDFFKDDKTSKEEKEKKLKESKESQKYLEKFLEIAITEGILEPKIFIKYDKENLEEGLVWAEIDQKDQAFLLNKITGSNVDNL